MEEKMPDFWQQFFELIMHGCKCRGLKKALVNIYFLPFVAIVFCLIFTFEQKMQHPFLVEIDGGDDDDDGDPWRF